MSILSNLRGRWDAVFNRSRMDHEMDDEIEYFLEQSTRRYMERGYDPDEARRLALIEFGGVERFREETREERGGGRLVDFLRDLRYSLRSLARSPVLAVTIVLTVGLGIGATTAIFSVINSVLIRPLPYPEPDQLYYIHTDTPTNSYPLSVADYQTLTGQQMNFIQIAGYYNTAMTFSRDDVVERIRGKFVTWSYFELLGITPIQGRIFNESDGAVGTEGRVVVSHSFWSRYLGGEEAAIGQAIRLNGRDYTVVGVIPREEGPFEHDRSFFIAVEWEPPTRRGPFFIQVLARLEPDADPAAAAGELSAINRLLFPIWQSSYQDEAATWAMADLKEVLVGDIGTTLVIVLGAVGFMLLIASTNATNLLLARAAQRGRELAVRIALGASRRRLLQHMLSESVVLSSGSALVGLLLSLVGIRLISTLGADFIPRTREMGLDGQVLCFLVAVTLGSTLLFGLIPALQGTRSRFGQLLRYGRQSASEAPGPKQFRRTLVVAQFAIAAPLLIGAGLLVGSLARLQRVDPGIDTGNILSCALYLPVEAYPDSTDVEAFWNEAHGRIRALPGVVGATMGNARPPSDFPYTNNFDLEDRPTPPDQSQPDVPWISVAPNYFDVMDIPLLQGRVFGEQDTGEAPPVAVVDQAWANRFYPGEDAVGRRFRSGGATTGPWTTVVGVVGEVKYTGLESSGEGVVYRPMVSDVYRFRYFLIRTSSDPMAFLPSVRGIVREMDPELPLTDIATVEDRLWESLVEPRYLTLLVFAFAAASLVLSIVGIYGVMSHHVQQHTRDIGIRIALGGRPADVLQAIIGQGMRLVILGVAVGIAGALILTRFMSSLLFEVRATDPLIFLIVVVVMLGVALTACFVPARRAATLDPVQTLRVE